MKEYSLSKLRKCEIHSAFQFDLFTHAAHKNFLIAGFLAKAKSISYVGYFILKKLLSETYRSTEKEFLSFNDKE